MNELRSITDAEEYFKELNRCKEEYLICVAVRDTFHKISAEMAKVMMDLGMEDLSSKGEYPHSWQGYLFVMEQGKILLNKLADVHMSLIEQMNVADISMQLVSKPYYSGDTAKIILDGYDLAVNYRGINVVVFDVQNRRLIDSVCFDFYPDEFGKNCSRLKDSLDIPLPRKTDSRADGNEACLDIDAELDSIIEKYNLDEYYPKYSYKKEEKGQFKI